MSNNITNQRQVLEEVLRNKWPNAKCLESFDNYYCARKLVAVEGCPFTSQKLQINGLDVIRYGITGSYENNLEPYITFINNIQPPRNIVNYNLTLYQTHVNELSIRIHVMLDSENVNM